MATYLFKTSFFEPLKLVFDRGWQILFSVFIKPMLSIFTIALHILPP